MYVEPKGDGMYHWLARNVFETAEHGGTHMDAPYHFNKNGWQIGDIPFERFFGKGDKINILFTKYFIKLVLKSTI